MESRSRDNMIAARDASKVSSASYLGVWKGTYSVGSTPNTDLTSSFGAQLLIHTSWKNCLYLPRKECIVSEKCTWSSEGGEGCQPSQQNQSNPSSKISWLHCHSLDSLVSTVWEDQNIGCIFVAVVDMIKYPYKKQLRGGKSDLFDRYETMISRAIESITEWNTWQLAGCDG